MDKIYTLSSIGIGLATPDEIIQYASVPMDPEISIIDPPAGECIDPTTFLAYSIHTEEIVGAAILYNYSQWYNSIEFGARIWNRDNWNMGYGREIAMLTCQYAFHEIGVYEVNLKVLPENTRAIKSYINAGFIQLRTEYIDNYLFIRMVRYACS